ncbi:MAG: hypothetical protein ABIT01_04130 [Thermoanaerobaculia bacterium]
MTRKEEFLLRKALILLSSAALAFLTMVPAEAQNVVPNADFNSTDVSNWNPPINFVISYDALDAFGSPTSGSARLANNSPTSFNSGGSYCLGTVTGGGSYDFGAMARVPSGQTGSGFVSVAVYWYQNNCNGTLSTITPASFSTSVPGFDTWSALSKSVTAPADATKAVMYLFVNMTTDGTNLQAYFDRIYFGPPGTMPVSLQHFRAE